MITGEPGRAGPAHLGRGARTGPPRRRWTGRSGHRATVTRSRCWPARRSRSRRPPRASGCAAPASTMLHQPTPRTDLVRWAEETTAVIDMIAAEGRRHLRSVHARGAGARRSCGMTVLTIESLLGERTDRARRHRRRRHRADAADVRFDRIAQGRPDHPRQHRRQRRGDDRRLQLRRRHRRDRQLAAVLPRHGHDGLPDGADVLSAPSWSRSRRWTSCAIRCCGPS